MNKELTDLVKIISGEMALEKKEKALEKAKKQAIEDEKNERRRKVVKGEAVLEKDPLVEEEKKVVQNIKLFEWEAPDRYEISYNTKYFMIIVALSLVLILLLAILGHYFLMGAIIAMLFLIYVLGTTKPQKVTHQITARGVDTGNKLFEWFIMKNFFFTKKNNQLFLIIETKLNIPGALLFLLSEKDKDAIFVLLQDKLLYKDIRKQGWLEKLNFGEYIPLEKV
jgi:hypothetical protein